MKPATVTTTSVPAVPQQTSEKKAVAPAKKEVKLSAAELAEQRRTAAPTPIGADAPHQERNSRPDVYAVRLFIWAR
jgi:hypothetical protein